MDRFDIVTRLNPEYVDRLYDQYQRDPRSVDETWREMFAEMDGVPGAKRANSASSGSAPGGNGSHYVNSASASQAESNARITADLPSSDAYSDGGPLPAFEHAVEE